LTYSGKHSRRLRLAAGVIAAVGLAALPLAANTAADAATTASHAGPASLLGPVRTIGGLPLLGVRPAAGDDSYYLSGGGATITAGGHTWTVTLFVSKSNFGVPIPGEVTLGITTPEKGGQEAHSWAFGNLPDSDFVANASTGAATVNSGSSLNPVTQLKLAFKPSGKHSVTKCASGSGGGSQTTFPGKLTGSVHLATGLKGLTLSKTGLTFSVLSQLQVSTDFCVPAPCSFASWEATSAKSLTKLPYTLGVGVQAGEPGHQVNYAEISKEVGLSAPKGAIRGDGAIIDVAAPKFNTSKRQLSVTTSRSGAVTGSMLITATNKGTSDTTKCSIGSTAYTETDVSYDGKYTGALTAHTLLTGTVAIGKTGSAGFDVITKLKKD
jgi:hypothetical protein